MTRPFSPLEPRSGLCCAYDAVIIGTGIGGLVCANLLLRAGLKVLLVEQHSMVGGYCSGFRRGGLSFDAASHFYPLLGNSASISGRLLNRLGLRTRWIKMDPVDQFHFPDGSRFAVPAAWDEYITLLKREFPAESGALDGFFLLCRKLYLWGILQCFREIETRHLGRYASWTVRDAIEQHFTSRKLKLLLTADCPHWGSPPCRTSFVLDSMLRLSYFEGNYYPEGGSQGFADELAAEFQAGGGHILMKSLVRQISVRDSRVREVEVETGPIKGRWVAKVTASCVISNADMRQTVFGMVGERHFPKEYVARLRQLRPSFSCFLSHIGVRDLTADTLARAHGYYWSDWDSDRVCSGAFQFKLFIPTLYDQQLAPPGRHIVIVQKVIDVDFESIQDWQAHKQAVERYVLERLERVIPDFESKIVHLESASARTSHRFTLNHHGAMLGWEMSPEQIGTGRPAIESPISGLYFVGHWSRPGGGITPVILSAMNVAARITGCDSLREFDFRDVDAVTGGIAPSPPTVRHPALERLPVEASL